MKLKFIALICHIRLGFIKLFKIVVYKINLIFEGLIWLIVWLIILIAKLIC